MRMLPITHQCSVALLSPRHACHADLHVQSVVAVDLYYRYENDTVGENVATSTKSSSSCESLDNTISMSSYQHDE